MLKPLDPNRFIEALKSRLGVDRDIDLAEELDLGKSTIASWRKRGSVPDTIVRRAREEFGLTRDQIDLFSAQGRLSIDFFAGVSFYYATLRLGKVLSDAQMRDFASRLYMLDAAVIDHLKLALNASPDGIASGGFALYEAVQRGEVASPEDLKSWLNRPSEATATQHAVPQAVPRSKPKRTRRNPALPHQDE